MKLDNTVNYIIHADDTSLFFSGTSIDVIIGRANQFLQSLNVWTTANSLTINVAKTKAIIFRAKNTSCTSSLPGGLSLASRDVEIVKNAKVLGVTFNEHMQWDETVQDTTIKLSKVVGVLYKHRNILPSSIMLLI